MKRIQLTKHTRHVQAGHVYEHIYAKRLSAYLQDAGLFSFLDYDIEAKTFYTGVVYIAITAYSARAIDALKDLKQLDETRITSDEIDGAIIQIFAE